MNGMAYPTRDGVEEYMAGEQPNYTPQVAAGGKPSKGTPKDKRLKENQPQVSSENADLAKVSYLG